MPRPLITGITGPDGPFLAELLLEKDCEVRARTTNAATVAVSFARLARA